MLILAFDTSSKTASVAILRDGDVLYDIVLDTGRNHSEVLLPAMEQACAATGIKISEIDMFACTLGPGSFTGLRIGVSTLKGLMMATGKPAVGVSSLAALAQNAGKTEKTICSVMDAGRGQIYLAYFRYDEEGLLIQLEDEQALAPQEIRKHHHDAVMYVGDGAVKYADDIQKNLGSKDEIAETDHQHVRASAVGRLAAEKFRRHELLDLYGCHPVYLRSADALPKKQLFP